jgi:hypothetical protein
VLAHAEIIKLTDSDSVPKYLRGFLGAVEADAGAALTGAASSSAFSHHQNKWTNAKFNIKTQSSVIVHMLLGLQISKLDIRSTTVQNF